MFFASTYIPLKKGSPLILIGRAVSQNKREPLERAVTPEKSEPLALAVKD